MSSSVSKSSTGNFLSSSSSTSILSSSSSASIPSSSVSGASSSSSLSGGAILSSSSSKLTPYLSSSNLGIYSSSKIYSSSLSSKSISSKPIETSSTYSNTGLGNYTIVTTPIYDRDTTKDFLMNYGGIYILGLLVLFCFVYIIRRCYLKNRNRGSYVNMLDGKELVQTSESHSMREFEDGI
jgi:hypothetical protein